MKLNKTAMFGFCRALKKQSGGLFLVSRHSEAQVGANGSFKATRAAMFGLDARIALAIFGALSVISGAALYSAIQNAKITSTITELNEIGKAVEQYMLDTGSDLPISSTVVSTAEELLTSTKQGWNGPYLSYTPLTGYTATHITSDDYDRLTINQAIASDPYEECSDVANVGKPCHYWIFMGIVPDDVQSALDLRIDGTSGSTAGNLHYDIYPDQVMYRIHPTMKQYR